MTAPKAAKFPAAALNVMFPVPAVKVSAPGPLTWLENKIFPAPAPVLSCVAPVKFTGPANWILSLVVVIFPARRLPPAPDWVKAPSKLKETPELKIKVLPTLIVAGPPLDVCKF